MALPALGLSIRHGTKADCHWMILRHYLRQWPAGAICVLILRTRERLVDCVDLFENQVGCILFTLPVPETQKRYGGLTWELARLWVDDLMPRNTESWFIAQAVRHVRKEHPEVDFLVSYADPSAGHKGTIYRASNWVPDGETQFSDGSTNRGLLDYIVNGKRVSRRKDIAPGVPFQRVRRPNKYRFFLSLKSNWRIQNKIIHRSRPGVHVVLSIPPDIEDQRSFDA